MKYYLICIVVLISSCNISEYENFINQDKLNPDLKTLNGVLNFSTVEEFSSVIENLSLNQTDQSKLETPLGFISLSAKLDNTNKNYRVDGNLDYEIEDEIVEDPYLLELLNEKREIIIDDVVFRILDKGVFAYKPEDTYKMEEYITSSANKQEMLPCGGDDLLLEVYDGVFYIQPSSGCGGEGGGYSPPLPPPNDGCYSTNVSDPSICVSNSSNIFGTTETCEYRTDLHRRIKAKFGIRTFSFMPHLA